MCVLINKCFIFRYSFVENFLTLISTQNSTRQMHAEAHVGPHVNRQLLFYDF